MISNPSANPSLKNRIFLHTLIFGLLAGSALAQSSSGKWNEVVGKKVVNSEGVTLGYVSDSAIDLENGRYVGMIISYGGFLGIGQKSIVVPPGAVVDHGIRGTLTLDIPEAKFRQAPTFALSKTVGPPYAAQVSQVYSFFGQSPYFTTDIESSRASGQKLDQLGYIVKGSQILLMPVENLQGKSVGTVIGLRDLDHTTGLLGGIVIRPSAFGDGEDNKIVQGQDLRYNSRHNRLRLNDHQQAFANSPDFILTGGGHFTQDNPQRPGTPRPPLVQGNSVSDKSITSQINRAIQGDSSICHYGKTAEVATVKGKTIVRGRAETKHGRDQIIRYAEAAAGRGNVTDQIEIQPMTSAERAIDTKTAAR